VHEPVVGGGIVGTSGRSGETPDLLSDAPGVVAGGVTGSGKGELPHDLLSDACGFTTGEHGNGPNMVVGGAAEQKSGRKRGTAETAGSGGGSREQRDLLPGAGVSSVPEPIDNTSAAVTVGGGGSGERDLLSDSVARAGGEDSGALPAENGQIESSDPLGCDLTDPFAVVEGLVGGAGAKGHRSMVSGEMDVLGIVGPR
jgi:hypothetical protein